MTLNLDDYTESMTALHHILTQTPLNKAAESAAELPSFTDKQLKAGLRTPWTAEQIGRLLVKYESEWYADESLSKWHEIDSLYQKQYDQKKQSIADELTQANITKLAERDYAMQILDKSYQQQTDEWQIEKQQRIKPSLWWREVAEGQAAIAPASTDTAESPETTPQPVLSNLCATGKVWHLHPVGIIIFTNEEVGITFKVIRNGIEYNYTISYESYDGLILYYEGYSPVPYVPKNSDTSGVTLGYGYDLGQQNRSTVINELSGIYEDVQIERLLTALGKRGEQARALLPSLIDITISKINAKHLSIVSKTRYAQQVVDIYPESIELSSDQKGALLSLVYNRGHSLLGSRRQEMKDIQLKLQNHEIEDIPNLFRSMKRLWEGTNQSGLVKRREDEAVFFEKGLF